MSQPPLPIADQPHRPAPKRGGALRQRGVHVARIALVLGIVWLMRNQHQALVQALRAAEGRQVTLEQAQLVFPEATFLGEWNNEGAQGVYDKTMSELGVVIQTSPQADDIKGYAGPTNLLIGLNRSHRVVGMVVLTSRDTPEHVAKVLADPRFLTQFNGLSWSEAGNLRHVDGVSGATLTSLAIAESAIRRLGSDSPSLRFPEPLVLADARVLYPEAAAIRENAERIHLWDALDVRGKLLGHFTRTAPFGDNVVGYQGPTDTLIGFDGDLKITRLAIRKTYETQKYVNYVREDYAFPEVFQGRHLEELAKVSPRRSGVEGVSGATMTSQAIAEAVIRAVREAQKRRAAPSDAWRISGRDLGTLLVTLFGLVIAVTHLRGSHGVRVCWQLVLISYLGFLNGDMVSQSLLVGWAQAGMPWHTSLGMAVLTVAALAVPVLSKTQFYCSHVCPFGAAQELLKRRHRWQLSLPHRISAVLKAVPVGLLVWVLVVAFKQLPYNLAAIEPFNAFVFRVAGWATIGVAIAGLSASLFVPMAYCKYGCPTGALLGFLRFNAHSGYLTLRDAAAVALLAVALYLGLT